MIELRLSAEQLRRMAEATARRERALAEPERIGGVALKPSQRDRLAQAERLAGGGLAERRQAMALVRRVEAEMRAAREAAAVEAGVAETLARAPGLFEVETVDVGEWRRDDLGALVRVKGRPVLDVQTVHRARRVDGLRSLHRAGLISDEDLDVLERYRAVYAAAQPPVRTSGLERSGEVRVDREAVMAAAMERGFAAQLLGEVRRVIGPGAADVVEAVAGRGESLRALAGGGRRWQANRDRLLAAISDIALLILR